MSIFDPHPRDSGAAHFDEIANALLDQGEQVSPAELHGCLCGLLGGGMPVQAEALLTELETTLDLRLHGELAQAVNDLLDRSVAPLTSGDFDFEPLLPEEDLELGQRVAAMAGWCRAFLGGFTQARVRAAAQADAVAPDSAEALKDFAAIAQAATDCDEEDEDAEKEYAELFEYLRVAAMNVLLDAFAAQDAAGESGSGLDDGNA